VCVQFIWSSYSGSIVFEEALPFKYSGKMKSLSVNSGVYYVKSLDMKHLVTVGIEGFYGPGRSERLGVNPGDWAASLCSDFIQNSAVKDIDFASVHAYPDTWSV
jgi:endo-1,4-beta-mannosidase